MLKTPESFNNTKVYAKSRQVNIHALTWIFIYSLVYTNKSFEKAISFRKVRLPCFWWHAKFFCKILSRLLGFSAVWCVAHFRISVFGGASPSNGLSIWDGNERTTDYLKIIGLRFFCLFYFSFFLLFWSFSRYFLCAFQAWLLSFLLFAFDGFLVIFFSVLFISLFHSSIMFTFLYFWLCCYVS